MVCVFEKAFLENSLQKQIDPQNILDQWNQSLLNIEISSFLAFATICKFTDICWSFKIIVASTPKIAVGGIGLMHVLYSCIHISISNLFLQYLFKYGYSVPVSCYEFRIVSFTRCVNISFLSTVTPRYFISCFIFINSFLIHIMLCSYLSYWTSWAAFLYVNLPFCKICC